MSRSPTNTSSIQKYRIFLIANLTDICNTSAKLTSSRWPSDFMLNPSSSMIRNFDSNLCRNATEYTYNHKNKYAEEITLHFINIKELKFSYKQNGNKLARALVSYLWEEMWWLHAFEIYVTMRLKGLYIIEKQRKIINIQKPNPRRWNARIWAPSG